MRITTLILRSSVEKSIFMVNIKNFNFKCFINLIDYGGWLKSTGDKKYSPSSKLFRHLIPQDCSRDFTRLILLLLKTLQKIRTKPKYLSFLSLVRDPCYNPSQEKCLSLLFKLPQPQIIAVPLPSNLPLPWKLLCTGFPI